MPGILVTGASGFIGRYTCAELKRNGLPFVAVDQRESSESQICDLTDQGAVSNLFLAHRFDCIIHLAAILPTAATANPALATRVNVLATIGLLETAISSGCRRFVFGSSSSVYGTCGLKQPISEDAPAAPCDVYGAGKRFVEIVGSMFSDKRGIEFVALRIATVVGPGARHTSSPWRSEIFEKLGTGARQTVRLPYLENDPLTLVYVEDIARMLVALAEQQSVRSTIYNSPAELWNAAEIKQFIESLDSNVEVILARRTRALAPLANGQKFVDDFAFAAPSLQDRLRKQATSHCSIAQNSP